MNRTQKASLAEIQRRFDKDVERFSNLATGQVSTVDATLSLELLTQAVARVSPHVASVLDLGCGADNYTLKLLQLIPNFNATLVDLSEPMLTKAVERISAVSTGEIYAIQQDFVSLELPADTFDAVVSGAAFHHLRSDKEWENVFYKVFNSLKKGGCFFISDLIKHDHPALNQLMWNRYADYLIGIGGEAYQKGVFDYIDKEDTPRSIGYQLDLMKEIGFSFTEILHKNSCFGVFGGIK